MYFPHIGQVHAFAGYPSFGQARPVQNVNVNRPARPAGVKRPYNAALVLGLTRARDAAAQQGNAPLAADYQRRLDEFEAAPLNVLSASAPQQGLDAYIPAPAPMVQVTPTFGATTIPGGRAARVTGFGKNLNNRFITVRAGSPDADHAFVYTKDGAGRDVSGWVPTRYVRVQSGQLLDQMGAWASMGQVPPVEQYNQMLAAANQAESVAHVLLSQGQTAQVAALMAQAQQLRLDAENLLVSTPPRAWPDQLETLLQYTLHVVSPERLRHYHGELQQSGRPYLAALFRLVADAAEAAQRSPVPRTQVADFLQWHAQRIEPAMVRREAASLLGGSPELLSLAEELAKLAEQAGQNRITTLPATI